MNFLRKFFAALKKSDDGVSALIASDSVRVFEIELLLFPVLVVLLASAALVCGGRCALWQWWTAVGMAVAVGWFQSRNTKPFYVGTSLYLLAILALWVACGISIVPMGDDQLRYHLPSIRLLTEGWNPVWQGRWDLITAAFGIDPSETKTPFVLPTAKGIYYLDAVAYFFIRNPFNLMMSAYFLLFMAAVVSVLRNFKQTSVFIRIAILLAMIKIVPCCSSSIDAVVGFAGICLLSAMHKCLAKNEWDWCQMLCYSFWMCIAKQTGALHCAVFWAILSVVVLIRWRWCGFRRLTLVAALMAFSFLLVGAAPYFSAWKEFGHPLYPKCTVDPEKYPIQNIVTCDFLMRNNDAAEMGHLGAYLRAYVSTALADTYYNHKLNRKDFSPDCLTWGFGTGYPTTTFRLAFCCSLILLLLCGKKEDVLIAIMLIVGSAAMPTEMIGYARYCPWMLGGVLFLMPLLAHGRTCRIGKWLVLLVFVYAFSFRSMVSFVGDCGCKLAYAQAGMKYLQDTPPSVVYNGHTEEKFASRSIGYFEIFFAEKGTAKRGDDVNKSSLGNLKLLQRQVPVLTSAKIIDFTTGGPEAERFRASNGSWKAFYDNSFKVAPEEALPKLPRAAEMVVVFPNMLCRRLTGRFAWR